VQRWADLVSAVLGNASEAQDIVNDKACKFSVSPQNLLLNVGETWQPGITSTLLDPNGNRRSCSVENWYCANLNVVDITPLTGSFTFPTGVAPGVANVSANCDGLLASTNVSVCSLSGTYQGQFSGTTISCAQRAPDGTCQEWGPPKSISGTTAVPFTQNGTSVSAVIVGYTFTGTNDNGNVTLTNTVPCNAAKSACPAGLSGTLSPDCLTFSGSFHDDRPRTIAGTFSLQRITP